MPERVTPSALDRPTPWCHSPPGVCQVKVLLPERVMPSAAFAGKTTFVRYLVSALGGEPNMVSSPTFTLLHQYQARIPLIHIDAYRLGDPEELSDIGFDELQESCLSCIEWASRVADLFDEAQCWQLHFDHAGIDQRVLTITPPNDFDGQFDILFGRDCGGLSLPVNENTSSVVSHDESMLDTDQSAALEITDSSDSVQQDKASKKGILQGKVYRLPLHEGQDAQVAAYLQRNRATAAARVWSWSWFLLAFVTGVTGAFLGDMVGDQLYGGMPQLGIDPASQPEVYWINAYLGHGLAVSGGIIAMMLLTSIAGAVIGRKGVPAGHEPLIVGPTLLLCYGLVYDWLYAVSVLTAVICLIYLWAIGFRLIALLLGRRDPGFRYDEMKHGELENGGKLPEPADGWPMYTILIPLYKETAIADKILHHLYQLDYPHDKLDVKFLLEADDPETLQALQTADMPAWTELVVVPDAQPKTKPRACNHGLERALGEFLVIFDAEDQPEPDQLKQAVLAYRQQSDPQLACLQAQLAYRNPQQNMLTRWFSLEYNVWFTGYLPGLAKLGGPIPLGGTSNHFRTDVLQELDGWIHLMSPKTVTLVFGSIFTAIAPNCLQALPGKRLIAKSAIGFVNAVAGLKGTW